MSAFKELTSTELEIVEFFWENEEATSFSTVLVFFNNQREKEWKCSSLSTHLLKLAKNGLITSKNRGRQVFYTVVMSPSQYETGKAYSLYDGSVKHFMTALYDGKKMSKKKIIAVAPEVVTSPLGNADCYISHISNGTRYSQQRKNRDLSFRKRDCHFRRI